MPQFRECDFELCSTKQYCHHCDLIENGSELASHSLEKYSNFLLYNIR